VSAEALTQLAQEAIKTAKVEHNDMTPFARATLRRNGLSILSLVESIKAAQRLVANVYIDWHHAGGVDDCKHGYGKGIPCRKCDEAAVATAFADAMKGE
jgi:hypothetical protein